MSDSVALQRRQAWSRFFRIGVVGAGRDLPRVPEPPIPQIEKEVCVVITETSVSIETSLGAVSLVWQGDKLCTVLLGPLQVDSERRTVAVAGKPPAARGQGLVTSMLAYFEGGRPRFVADADLSHYTEFQRAVWGATKEIPHGETRSYSWVAARIGRPRAVRAVGAALGRNPVPIVVPCHRVVGANGSLTGFAYGLGWKEALLNLERPNGASPARSN